ASDGDASDGGSDTDSRDGDTRDETPADRRDTPTPGTGREEDPAAPDATATPDQRADRSTAPGTGRHRGKPDPAETGRAAEGRPGAERAAPGRAGEGLGRHVDRVRRAATNQTGYRVAEGDTLSTIADRHGVEGGWSAVYERNEDTVGTDPN
ncbi:LysM peptidoglycan-binding domain-containing protein, partial [Streptomyces sp. OF3]